MKKGIFILQFKYHRRSTSLLFCRTKCHKKGFNPPPLQRCWRLCAKNSFQRFLMFLV